MESLMELVDEFEIYPTLPVDIINNILTKTKELKMKELADKLIAISAWTNSDPKPGVSRRWDLIPDFQWVLGHKEYQKVKRRCQINKSKIGSCLTPTVKARLNDKEELYNIDELINPNRLPFVKKEDWEQMRSELYYLETGKKVRIVWDSVYYLKFFFQMKA